MTINFGPIPAGWRMGRIKDLVGSAANGVWGDEPLGDGRDVHCVRAADFDRYGLVVRPDKLPSRRIDSRGLRNHRLHVGDLVWEKSGGGETQPVGLAVKFDLRVAAVCSNFCTRIVPSAGTDSRYLAYVFAAAYAVGLNQRSIKQTTGLQNLDGKAFLAEPWPIPGLAEQRRIANFLDVEVGALRRAGDLLAKQLQLVCEREASILEEETSVYDAPIIPVKRLVSRITSGPRGWGSNISDTGVPFIRIANIPQRGIVLNLDNLAFVQAPASAERERTRTRLGDVLVSITADIGSIGIVEGHVAGGSVSQHIALLRPFARRCHPRWLAYALKAPQANTSLAMSSYGGAKIGLGLSDVAETRVPAPSLAEQAVRVQRIDEAMEWAKDLRSALSRKRELLIQRKNSLVVAAVTGQVDATTARGVEV